MNLLNRDKLAVHLAFVLFIDVFPMTYVNNIYNKNSIKNFINNAIISHSNAKSVASF